MNTDIRDAVHAGLQRQSQAGEDYGWDESAARAATNHLADAGWLGVGLSDELGGEGGDLADAAAVTAAVSEAGWPSPTGDLVMVSNAVRTAAGIETLAGTMTLVIPRVATVTARGAVTLDDAPGVPWAPWADAFIVPADDGSGQATMAVVDARDVQLTPGRGLNGAPLARVRIIDAPALSSTRVTKSADAMVDEIMGLGALARSVQAAAALDRVQELTVAHVHTRKQFGRPVAAFQAVQQHLAELAGLVSAAKSAVADALDGANTAVSSMDSRIAGTKTAVSTTAGEVARIAHQLHGAVGIAREHELHRHTLSLLTWRDEFGDERYWARRLAAAAVAAPDLWTWAVAL